jgi:hypothetical protein
MPLYTGAFLIPGIVSVKTSETPRRVGTRDFILNNDGSSHSSVTIDLVRPTIYKLHIDQINSIGAKKILASIIVGFKEEWILQPDGSKTNIHRKLEILHADNFLSKIFAEYILKPQLIASFKSHHKKIIKALTPSEL